MRNGWNRWRRLCGLLGVATLGCSGGGSSSNGENAGAGGSGASGICTAQCAAATCSSPEDHCGGLCPSVCKARESGCTDDVLCPAQYSCIAQSDGSGICYPADCAFRVLAPPMCGPGDAECGPCPEGTAGTGGSDGFAGGGGSAGGAMVSATGAENCTGSVTTAANAAEPFGSCRVSLAEENDASFYSFIAQATDAAGDSLLAEMDFVLLPQAGAYSSADSSPYSELHVTWQQPAPVTTYQAKTTPSASIGSIELDLNTVNNFKLAQGTGYYTISGKLTATVPDEAMSQSITVSLSF